MELLHLKNLEKLDDNGMILLIIVAWYRSGMILVKKKKVLL